MKTITQTTTAWITEFKTSFIGPQDFREEPDGLLQSLSYCDHDMSASGWTKAGTATITLEAISSEEMTKNAIQALKEQITTVKADAQQQVNALEEKVKNLLALSYQPADVE